MEQFYKNKKPSLAEFDQYIENYRSNLTNHCAPTGENADYFTTLKAQKLAEWLKKYGVSKPDSILDFGCGDGMMTNEVKKVFPDTQMHGVDPSKESIEAAKTLTSSITFTTSSELIPYENNTFDVIYAAGVFHHIPFEMHSHYIQECLRVLKPNGLLVLFELNPLNPGTRYIFNRNPIDQNATMLNHWYAKKLVKKYGFKETIFYCFFPHTLRFLRPLEKYLNRVPLSGLYGIIVRKTS